ncbi:BglG family transcription antiterminator [Heyndrickxia ginsengihumi]|uniref:Transcriptional antiterminator BglG n=2 Tax=Heyndrickxia ginsengihumi TaxID=363870 RepID=A0A0A6VDI6_9BACI|nr:BglG family transcription antiterminator [Heyndrickxia ginsengihumi]KHD85558.1 transcriptional antiterminator BglG [Heyndrickxia ginsengihumi]
MSDISIDNRLFQLIEMTRKKEYCTLDYFAQTMDVSTRTIRNYIKQLNSDLKGIASLVSERGKGYRLMIRDEEQFKNFMKKVNSENSLLDSPQSRIAFIIDQLINSEGMNTLDEMAFNMNIGRTTLINELKKATVSLKTYNLAIHGKPNSGMYLSGTEHDLRFFILDHVYNYLYRFYPLDEDIKESIIRIANRYDLESNTQQLLMQFIIVMLDRLLHDHPIHDMNEKYTKLLDTKDYEIAKEIAAVIENQLPISIPQQEVLFITLPIAGRRTPTNNQTMVDIAITDDIKRLLNLIIEQIGFDESVIQENRSFFTDLQYHLTFMLNRLMFDLRLKNPLLSDVKEKYPVAFKMAEIAGQVIENEYALKVSEDELGYIAFYFGVFITQNDVKVKNLKKVAVICGTGRGTAKLVAIQLQRILNQHTAIELFSENEVTKERLADYDLVFSTVELSFETDSPLIMINEIFDESSVSREIEKVTYLQKFKLKQARNHHSIIRLLINEEKYFVLDHTKRYYENLDHMVDVLVQQGYLDDDFKERLKVRNEKGSMVFDQYIALPHTVNYKSDQIELALGVFPEKIKADGKEIKLVFLLGIPKETDNDSSLLVKIYDEVLRIGTDKELIERLSKATNYIDVSQYLEQASRL